MIPTFLSLTLCFVMMSAPDDAKILRHDWSIVVKTHNGTVSVLRSLTLAEAEKTYDSLDDRPAPGQWKIVGDADVESRTILGPDGWDGCPKAFHHDYCEDACELVKGGFFHSQSDPEIGKFYRYKACRFCGHSDPNVNGYYADNCGQ